MIKEVFNSFLNIIYPKRCKLCGEVVELKRDLCPECESTPVISGEICDKCGREKTGCVCAKEKFSPKYKAFCAPYYYDGCMEKAIVRFKNYGCKELGAEMSKRIAKTVKQRFDGVSFDIVTCVPMTKKKQKERGYNQSALLAEAVAKELNAQFRELLVKTVDTNPQRFSSAKERQVNLYGAFELAEGESVEGKTVLIIDDVKTTGSTLNECATVIMSGKAQAAYAAAFTVTKKKS